MDSKLISLLTENDQPIEGLYTMWRNGYRTDSDQGTVNILQLALDLTGYCYELQLEDLENNGSWRTFVRNKLIKSRCEIVVKRQTIHKRVMHLFEQMLARNYGDLLQNNAWFNELTQLLIAFCESNDDECGMVGGYLSALVMANIAYVRDQLLNDQASNLLEKDDSPLRGSQQRLQYLNKIFRMMLRNVEGNCAYELTLPVICDLTCQMLQTYPKECTVNNAVLSMLATFLQHRHNQMFHTVATCLRDLLNIDDQEMEVAERVAVFFVEVLKEQFSQAMFTYKSSEKVSMEVVVSIQRLNYGQKVFDEVIVESLRQQMFHADDSIRAYAIDFHVGTLCSMDDTDNAKNFDILQHILDLYVQYEHSFDSLSALILDLWQLEFFDDWDIMFKLLREESARQDNLFMMYSVVHVINQCFLLLVNELEQKSGSHSRLLGLLKGFMRGYPSCLRDCSRYEHAYTILLQSAEASFHARIKQFCENIDQYYEELFAVLEEVAHTGRNYYMLSKNLAVIRSYWNIILDVEQMWSDLLQQYADKLYETRVKINSRNIGKCKELTEQYGDCVTRITAFLELDHDVRTHLPNLMHIVFNDCRLVEKMQLSREQISVFYRLYKCLFHIIVKGLQAEANQDSMLEPSNSNLWQTGESLKKRVHELIRVLIKQLQKYEESLATSVHMFISLCDMLLVTQDAVGDIGIAELEAIVYPVESGLLQKMATFLLNYVYSKTGDWHEAPIMKQKQMLIKYVQFYELHESLPGIVDTHYIVANFAIDTAFDKQLRDLMKVLFRSDPTQFCEVIAQAAFLLLQGYKSQSSVKNFFKKFQTFALAKLSMENKEDYHSLMAKVMEKILNSLMQFMSDPGPSTVEAKRMFKLIEPLLPDIPIDDRLMMENLVIRHPQYSLLNDSGRKIVNRFVKHLNPQG